MIPFFGRLSDKTNSRYGKRIPYIVVGLLLTAVVFPLIAVSFLYNSLIGVILMMMLILIIMNAYRSPAVALMPDITPKPLRSQANGIINLIGYLGAIIAGVIVIIVGYKKDQLGEYLVEPNFGNTVLPFVIASTLAVIMAIILFVIVKENKLLASKEEELSLGEELSETFDTVEGDKLSQVDKRNLIIVLIAALLWFMSFNALETFISTYCDEVLNDLSTAGLLVIVLTFSSILTFVPAGILANRFGRKRSVVFGLVLIVGALGLMAYLNSNLTRILLIVLIAICGVGWATINVNSYPMLVEMANKDNIGKFTGYYYTASMSAQTITPVLIGYIMSYSKFGLHALFPYSFVLMTLALLVFINFKASKHEPLAAKVSLLESFDVED
jgi:MFS family permease